MQNALDRVKQRDFPGVRLLQAGYHNRSLSLYAKLGFIAQELLSTMQGPALGVQIPGYSTRAATELDLEMCNEICAKVHGHDRAGELTDAIKETTATVVEHEGRIVGYSSSIAFFGHAVAETNDGLKALIGAAVNFGGPGFLVPTRNAELFLWCGAWSARGAANDADEHRSLQRTGRSFSPFGTLLMTHGTSVSNQAMERTADRRTLRF